MISLTTYKKRGGTDSRGKDYEWLLCAFYSLNLTTSSLVVDFDLSTNNSFFGDFDDIVLRVKFRTGSTKVFLIQSKHTENKKNLTLESLKSANGDFSIAAYHKTYKNILSLPCFHYILLTNRSANYKDGTKLDLECGEISMKRHSCIGDNLLNTNSNNKKGVCSVFKFDSCINQDFFSNFFLYVNQHNDLAIKQEISNLLKNIFYTDIFTLFKDFMHSWWSGNYKLCKSDVAFKLAELVFSPMVKTLSGEKSNERTKLLEEQILNFDITLVGDCDKISTVFSKIDDDLNVKIASMTALKFGLITNGISRIDQLSLEIKNKVLWYLDKLPLLIRVEKSKIEQIKSAFNLLSQFPRKKFIVVGFADFRMWKVFRDFSDIRKNERHLLSNHLRISLQGRNSISLEELEAADSSITSCFQVDQLLQSCEENFNVGEYLERLPSPYIKRRFFKITLDHKVVDSLKNAKILLSCNGHKSSKFEKHLIEVSSADRRSDFFTYHAYATDKEFDTSVVASHCKSNILTHHFKVLDNHTIQWLASNKSIEDLQIFRKRSSHVFDEEEICENLQNTIRILTSHRGTGKTTFLTKLKNSSKGFVLYFNLKDHLKFFEVFEEEPWLYFVEWTCVTRKYSSFERNLLKNFQKQKIIVLWDNFDELNSDLWENFKDVVCEFKKTGIRQWITSEKRVQDRLEHMFGVFAITILPFTKEEQSFYIENRCECFEAKLFEKFFENINILDNQEYLGVPLQLDILTEILSRDPARLNCNYTLIDLFSAFIDGRYKRIFASNFTQVSKSVMEDAKNHRMGQYQLIALKNHTNATVKKLSRNFIEDLRTGDYLGLVEGEHEFQFVHKVFGEYFCALYLVENRPQDLPEIIYHSKNRNIKFFFDLMLANSNETFQFILYQKFQEVKVASVKDSAGRNPLHLLCSYGKRYPPQEAKIKEPIHHIESFKVTPEQEDEGVVNLIRKFLQICDPLETDEFGWSCFNYIENSCSLGLLELFNDLPEILPTLHKIFLSNILFYAIKMNLRNVFTSIKDFPFIIDSSNENLLHVAALHNRTEFLSTLLKQPTYKRYINMMNKDYWTPLHFATFNGDLSIIKLLLSNGAALMNRQPSLMSLAVAKGRKDLVEFFISCGCSSNEFYHTNFFTTSVYQALAQKREDILKLLLENGAKLYCINSLSSRPHEKPNFRGMNIFHMLLENEQFEEADLVLEKSIHVNSVDHNGQTGFHHAARTNQERIVKYLLHKGGNSKLLEENGWSPLHFAAKHGSLEVGKVLIKDDADLELLNEDGNSAIHLAVEYNNPEFVELLIENGVNVDFCNKIKRTPSHLAALYDLVEVLELLKSKGADFEAWDGLYGRTVLHLAAWKGGEDSVAFLLKTGVQVDASCRFGYTPLHLAVEEVKKENCQLLLRMGASVSSKNINGKTPLDLIPKNYLSFLRFFLSFDKYPLHSAVKRGDAKFLEELLQTLNVCAADQKGNTSLHLAANHMSSKDLVTVLLSSGANRNLQNRKGWTPLLCAVQSCYRDEGTIQLLLSQENVNIANENKATPLHIAVQNQCGNSIVEVLLKKGANTDMVDDLGLTPLHYACANGDLEVVQTLINEDSNVDKLSKSGRTPLHMASRRGHFAVVKLLVDSGALLFEDSEGSTPVREALISESSDIFHFLYNKFDTGLDIVYMGKNILHVAAKNGKLDIVKFYLLKGLDLRVDFYGSTILEEALYNRHLELFQFLKSRVEFDVNKYNKRYGRYPLHEVSLGEKNLVEDFLYLGANIEAVDDDGNTALHIAMVNEQEEIFLLLLNKCGTCNVQNKSGASLLHTAVSLHNKNHIEALLKSGIDADLLDNSGNSAFDLVLKSGYMEHEEILKKMKNFNVNKPSKCRQLPLLHMAGTVELVEWLLENGASVNATDNRGNTALHYAVLQNKGIVSALLKKNCDLEAQNVKGETPLHLAASSCAKNLKLLLDAGASPHSTTKYGATPLLYALKDPRCFKILYEKSPQYEVIRYCTYMKKNLLQNAVTLEDLEGVKFFLKAGLKINEANNEGTTALTAAVTGNHLEILKLLLEKDEKKLIVDIFDARGKSLLYLAADMESFEVVKLLIKNKARTDVYSTTGKMAAEVRRNCHIEDFLKGQRNGSKYDF